METSAALHERAADLENTADLVSQVTDKIRLQTFAQHLRLRADELHALETALQGKDGANRED